MEENELLEDIIEEEVTEEVLTSKEVVPVQEDTSIDINESPLLSEAEEENIKKNKRKRIKGYNAYYEFGDMKYRGPMNVRMMRILAWVLMSLTTLSTAIGYISIPYGHNTDALVNILSIIGSASVSCFLLASFSYILQNRDSFKRILILYGSMAVLLYVAFVAGYFGYVGVFYGKLFQYDYVSAISKLNKLFSTTFGKNLSFNVFLDLFLCTLLCFFIFYNPKMFKGKKIYIFRAFAIIPVAIYVLIFIFTLLNELSFIYLPAYMYPMLTTKSPIAIFAFATIAITIKIREVKIKKLNVTREEYLRYFYSNRNSWFVSKVILISFIIYGILDLILVMVLSGFFYVNNIDSTTVLKDLGVGKQISFLLLAPVALLFSFNKRHIGKTIDVIIPLAGMGAMAFIIFNGLYFTILGFIKGGMGGIFGGL